ncbi:MAG TPA: hypothetical protein VMV33_01930 [Rhodocyclaceae bacterium]|nr:hypothetical protein [Rhodocyclaceae bacterium]
MQPPVRSEPHHARDPPWRALSDGRAKLLRQPLGRLACGHLVQDPGQHLEQIPLTGVLAVGIGWLRPGPLAVRGYGRASSGNRLGTLLRGWNARMKAWRRHSGIGPDRAGRIQQNNSRPGRLSAELHPL